MFFSSVCFLISEVVWWHLYQKYVLILSLRNVEVKNYWWKTQTFTNYNNISIYTQWQLRVPGVEGFKCVNSRVVCTHICHLHTSVVCVYNMTSFYWTSLHRFEGPCISPCVPVSWSWPRGAVCVHWVIWVPQSTVVISGT